MIFSGILLLMDPELGPQCFLDSCGAPEKVDLLPYHAMGENKYIAIGKSAQYFNPPDNNKLNELKAVFD